MADVADAAAPVAAVAAPASAPLKRITPESVPSSAEPAVAFESSSSSSEAVADVGAGLLPDVDKPLADELHEALSGAACQIFEVKKFIDALLEPPAQIDVEEIVEQLAGQARDDAALLCTAVATLVTVLESVLERHGDKEVLVRAIAPNQEYIQGWSTTSRMLLECFDKRVLVALRAQRARASVDAARNVVAHFATKLPHMLRFMRVVTRALGVRTDDETRRLAAFADAPLGIGLGDSDDDDEEDDDDDDDDDEDDTYDEEQSDADDDDDEVEAAPAKRSRL